MLGATIMKMTLLPAGKNYTHRSKMQVQGPRIENPLPQNFPIMTQLREDGSKSRPKRQRHLKREERGSLWRRRKRKKEGRAK